MPEKNCSKCGELKPISKFYKRKSRIDGIDGECKSCVDINHLKYIRTKQGLMVRIYEQQRSNSKRRRHAPPEYNLTEFREWALSKPEFHTLFTAWAESGYEKMMSPSADRLDDYKGYSLDRLQWMTWAENKQKGFDDRKNGINNKQSKSVIQVTREGILIQEYYSQREACRRTSVSYKGISACCLGDRKTAGGFVWCFG